MMMVIELFSPKFAVGFPFVYVLLYSSFKAIDLNLRASLEDNFFD